MSTNAPTECPFCDERGARHEVHAHIVTAHPERLETGHDEQSGRMHYRVACPVCEDSYEHRVKPRSRDADFLETFAAEIRMVGFDMLLNHMEAAHGEQQAPESAQEADEPMPAVGPGGGRGRPGQAGIPQPPGMGGDAHNHLPGPPAIKKTATNGRS